jgi:methionyl-tRNA synthetase
MSRHVLTAVAWPYANGPRHIGHVSGFGVPSDVFSRYMRMAGHDVLMVSGPDEHGTPILVQAEQEGVGARELADRYNRRSSTICGPGDSPATCSPGPRLPTTTPWRRRCS